MSDTENKLKKALRKQALNERDDFIVDGEKAREISGRICAHIVQEIEERAAGTIGIYWPIRSEVDVRHILVDVMQTGWNVALPCVVEEGHPMVFRLWDPSTDLVPGYMDILEPDPASEEVVPDIALVPLAAFDRTGGRLGYGGGFYDRTLKVWSDEGYDILTIGCAYSIQEVARVPMESHDVPINMIATEKEMIRFDE